MDQLYREYIIDHYKNPRNFGELEPHDAEFHDRNPVCGDEMGVHIRLNGDRIEDLRFHGQGCAISQASASTAISWSTRSEWTSRPPASSADCWR